MENRVIRALNRQVIRSITTLLLFVAAPLAAQDISLSQAVAGMQITGSGPYHGGFGNVNGLGVGTPGSGISLITSGVPAGAFYWSPVSITSTLNASAVVRAYVSTNFVHAGTLRTYLCIASCSSFSAYAQFPTTGASALHIVDPPGLAKSQKVTIWIGLLVGNQNGGTAYTGSDTATIRFDIYDSTGITNKRQEYLQMDTPTQNVQTAVRLVLSSALGGLPVLPSSDFSLNYGNVNGQGVGTRTAGLSLVSAAGGVIYSTPYQVEADFSGFASTTGRVSVYVSVDFVHRTTLILQDSASPGGPYTNISKSSGSPTAVVAAASSGSITGRYLGLFVSAGDGAAAFPGLPAAGGADSAALTYTLTVP